MVEDTLPCFKAYDIRGQVPGELNPALAHRIGRVLVDFLNARQIAVGWDVRSSSPALVDALCEGIRAAGADACRIGRCGTEELYFTVFDRRLDGGVMVTASHNPPEYNGMKIVREQSRPLSSDTGLWELRDRIIRGEGNESGAVRRGRDRRLRTRPAYLRKLLSFVEPTRLKPLRIVADAGNGGAGEIINLLQAQLPFQFIHLRNEPDGTFPHGVPNPMLPENRLPTAAAVREYQADFGIAWDGDFDRCFFFDERGDFIEGYYLVGLLARVFLQRHAGAAIICDPRLIWNTLETVSACGGRTVQSRAGHAFIKDCMRHEDAVYGGEMSAHHYFRDFGYCDSGMIPWLLIADLISASNQSLSALIDRERFPVSGEINRRVEDVPGVMARVEQYFQADALSVERLDGLSMFFPSWRFNLRPSNTEPLLRLNLETRSDTALLKEKTEELLSLLGGF